MTFLVLWNEMKYVLTFSLCFLSILSEYSMSFNWGSGDPNPENFTISLQIFITISLLGHCKKERMNERMQTKLKIRNIFKIIKISFIKG